MKNVIYEQARFNRRNQQSREMAKQYTMALFDLVENCNYGDLKNELIHGCLIIGNRDITLSEKPQLDPKLTLKRAKTVIWQIEALHEQQQTLSGTENAVSAVISFNAIGNKQLKFHGCLHDRNEGQAPMKPQAEEKCGAVAENAI